MALGNQIVDIQENLLLKQDGTVFALYEVEPYIVNAVDEKRKEELKSAVLSMLTELQGKGIKDIDIVQFPYPKDLLETFRTLAKDIAADTEEMAYQVLERTYNYLMSTQECYEYAWFLSIPLKKGNFSVDLKEVMKTSFENTADSFVEALGFERDVLEGWEKKYEQQREELEKSLTAVRTRRLSRRETIFVNRYPYLRSLFVDQEYEVDLIETSISNLGDGAIDFERLNILEFQNDTGTQYVAFLPVSYVPENMSYLHFVERLQTAGFPVELSTKVKFSKTKGLPFNNIRSKGRSARAKLKNTEQEAGQAGSVGKKSISQSKYLVENMEQKIDLGIPMVQYLQTVVVSDTDLSVLRQKIHLVMTKAKECHISLSRASGDQLYLYAKHKFGELLDLGDKNFIQYAEVGGIAENLFFIQKKVGQEIGFYLGKIDNQLSSWHSRYTKALKSSDQLVFSNLFEGNKEMEGKDSFIPHVQVSGDSGEGKTFLVSYLHFYSSLLRSQTLYIDPKREKRQRYEKVLKAYEEKGIYPEAQVYIRSINFVTLDHAKESNLGVLDPLVFLEPSKAKDLIVSLVNEIQPLEKEKKFEKALLNMTEQYIEKRQKGETVGSLSIFKALTTSEIEEVRDTAELLIEKVKRSVLGLVFSDGQNQPVDLRARNTILEIANLDLPNSEYSQSQLTLQNKKSLVVLYALGNYLIEFGEQDYTVQTGIFLDEAWQFNLTAYGRGLIERIERLGRAQNVYLTFTSQEPEDSNRADGKGSAFGSYFCFHSDVEGMAEKVLSRLGVKVTDDSLSWFDHLTKGQCLFKDHYGRVERITIDGLFPEINELFKKLDEEVEVAV